MTADAHFCSSCGVDLATATDRASPPSPASALDDATPADDLRRYVPEALLARIRAARRTGTMRGERRTVTMLFADLVGSTAAAERLDPEEWAEIVNGAFEHLIAPVYRYEGTLARLQGDAILAFFGAPIAHEDDPIRAVHAGLEMREAVAGYADDVRRRTGVPIAVRVGINTGLVVVGEVGSDLRVEYTALGDAINVAARMEQTAEPGTVQVTADTAALLGGAFDVTLLGPVDVKGKSEPVAAVRIDGVAEGQPGGPAAADLVGRDAERAALWRAVERLEDGIGSVVTLVGEAGLGKSRLLATLHEDLAAARPLAERDDDPGEVAWLQGQSRSFETASPYAPFRDLAGRWLGLRDLGPDEVFDRIAAAVERHHGHADLDAASYLTHAAGAPLPQEQAALLDAIDTAPLHARTTAAIVGLLEAAARERPLVLVLDDLHWADALSLSLAELLIASAERVPLALVVAVRPVRDEPAWRLVEFAARDAAHLHTAIELGPLDDATATALLDALADADVVDDDRRRQLLDRAGGNPLFLEELVGSLADTAGVAIPTSLAGLLTSRLDRLDHATRRVAEVAAVVGQEFDLEDLAALADGHDVDARVTELVRRGVVVERQRQPSRRYAFRHALVQDAAYQTVLLKDRRALHGRLARHLEASGAAEPHVLAHHHLASDAPDAAFPWLIQAGERAARTMAVGEAIRLFATALERVPVDADPDLVAHAHLGLGDAYALVPDLGGSEAAYQSLVDFGQRCARPALQVKALNQLGMNAAMLAADFEAAGRYLERARTIAVDADDEAGLAEYHMNSCFVAATQGNLDRAIAHDEETTRIGVATGSEELRLIGLTRRALNLVVRADLEAAVPALEEATEVARELGDEEALALLVAEGEAQLLEVQGRPSDALAALEGAAPVLDRYGSFQRSVVCHEAARLCSALGRIEEAGVWLDQAERAIEETGATFELAVVEATRARLTASLADAPSSDRHRQRALEVLAAPLGDFQASTVWSELARAGLELRRWETAEADVLLGLEASSSTRFWERPRLLVAGARAAVERRSPARARDLVDEAAAYVRQRGMTGEGPQVAVTAGLVARAEGDLAGAAEVLATAEETATSMGYAPLACEAARLRAEIAVGLGRRVDGAEHARRADAIAEQLLAPIVDPSLRARYGARLGVATQPGSPAPA